jgi:hypothetical protein
MKKKNPVSRKRPKQIKIRVSEAEQNLIKERVSKSNVSQNEYIIKAVLNKKIIVVEGLPELTKEIKRIGINLNQLTKLAHEGKVNCKSELIEIEEELNKAWQLLRSLNRDQV